MRFLSKNGTFHKIGTIIALFRAKELKTPLIKEGLIMKSKFIAVLTLSTLAFFATASAKSNFSDMRRVNNFYFDILFCYFIFYHTMDTIVTGMAV